MTDNIETLIQESSIIEDDRFILVIKNFSEERCSWIARLKDGYNLKKFDDADNVYIVDDEENKLDIMRKSGQPAHFFNNIKECQQWIDNHERKEYLRPYPIVAIPLHEYQFEINDSEFEIKPQKY